MTRPLNFLRRLWLARLLAGVACIWAFPTIGMAAVELPPRVFLIGGSTMASYPPERVLVGWGQVFPAHFKDATMVQNHGRSGRSSKSFIDQGLWAKVIGEIAKGDYLIIQFGTNDTKVDDPSRYTEPRGSYRANLERFIREVRAKGAFPLLATSVVRRSWSEAGRFEVAPSEWQDVTREVAAAMDVPLLDLRARTEELECTLGPEGSKALHLYLPAGKYDAYPKGAADNTHYCEFGARQVARLAAQEIRRLQLPLARWLAD